MKARIELFNALDKIAKQHLITDEEWAKKANMRRPSISELRRLAKIKSSKSDEKIGRACTLDKVITLFLGLNSLLGGDVLRNDILNIVAEEKDQDVRLIMWSMILREAPKETKDSVESSMKVAAKTITAKKK